MRAVLPNHAEADPGIAEDFAGPRQSWLPTSLETLVGVGFGLYLSWVNANFFGIRIVGPDAYDFLGINLSQVTYVVSSFALIVTLAVCAGRSSQTNRLISRPKSVIASHGCMAGFTLPLLINTWAPSLSSVLQPALSIVVGAGMGIASGVGLLQWGKLLSVLGKREIVVSVCVAAVVSGTMDLLFQGGGPLVSNHLSDYIAIITLADAVCALVAGILFFYILKSDDILFEYQSFINDTDTYTNRLPSSDKEHRDVSQARSIVGKAMLAVLLIQFVSNSCREFCFGAEVAAGAGSGSRFLQVYIFVLLATVAVAVILLRGFAANKADTWIPSCYRIAIFAAIAGCLLAAPILGVYWGASSLAGTAVSLTSLFLWIIMAGICHKYRERTIIYFAVLRIGCAVGSLLATFAASGVLEAGTSIAAFTLLGVGVLLLFIVYSTVLTEATLSEALELIPRQHRRPFVSRCRSLANQYGLTDRELEVLMLFAKGRDSAYIQDHLALSKSTVSTHRQHIYSKLGVHSHQAMLNLLYEDEGGEGGGAH